MMKKYIKLCLYTDRTFENTLVEYGLLDFH